MPKEIIYFVLIICKSALTEASRHEIVLWRAVIAGRTAVTEVLFSMAFGRAET